MRATLKLVFLNMRGDPVFEQTDRQFDGYLPRAGEMVFASEEMLDGSPEDPLLPGNKLAPGAYVVMNVVHRIEEAEVSVLLQNADMVKKMMEQRQAAASQRSRP